MNALSEIRAEWFRLDQSRGWNEDDGMDRPYGQGQWVLCLMYAAELA